MSSTCESPWNTVRWRNVYDVTPSLRPPGIQNGSLPPAHIIQGRLFATASLRLQVASDGEVSLYVTDCHN